MDIFVRRFDHQSDLKVLILQMTLLSEKLNSSILARRQLLIPNEILDRDGRSSRLPEHELGRIQSFFTQGGDSQAELSYIQYGTKQSPIPTQITSGIRDDANPSATLNEDVMVINKMIERIVHDKESGGKLLDDVFKSLGDTSSGGPARNTVGIEHRASQRSSHLVRMTRNQPGPVDGQQRQKGDVAKMEQMNR